jgi:dCTP deaminase
MFMSDVDIQDALDSGWLSVSEPAHIQPSSLELHLGEEFRTFPYDPSGSPIDPFSPPEMVREKASADLPFVLAPHGFVLAHTRQTVAVSNKLACQVDGKSSLARIGLQVHMTSGFIDPGFIGQITLELFNASPRAILLHPGMLIAQMFVFRLDTPAARPYGTSGTDSRYQGQMGATPSRYGERIPLSEIVLAEADTHRVRVDMHEPAEYPSEGLEWLG